MPPTKKTIPLEDIKGLKTLLDEGLSHEKIAKYYSEQFNMKISQKTIWRRVQELKESER